MKRWILAALLLCATAAAQTCVPGGGVTCTTHIGLWVLPFNYTNWNTPVNDNSQLIDNWSVTVLPLSGGTMTGNLILNADPTTGLQAATKNYVDTHIASGSFTLGATAITLGTTTTAVTGLTIDGVLPATMSYVDPTSSIQTQLNGKAASGANSNITGLFGLTTPLSVAQGGSGATTLTGYLKGNGTSPFTASATIPVADVTGAAPLASPAFTGTPTAPTPVSLISTTQIPTTAYVATYYAPLASPALTGTPTAPTPGSVISTTQIPTTAYVATYYAPLASPTFTGTVTAPALVLNGDSSFSAGPRAFLFGDTGNLTAVVSNGQYDPVKVVKSGTIENVVGTASAFTCSVNPVITLEDCGTSAGTCATPTALGSVTLTAANTLTGGSITSATLTSGHYLAWETTAGTCTALNISASAEFRMN